MPLERTGWGAGIHPSAMGSSRHPAQSENGFPAWAAIGSAQPFPGAEPRCLLRQPRRWDPRPPALHRPLRQPRVQEGSPGKPGFTGQDEGAWAVRNAGSAASPVPAEGAGRQRLPAPLPGSQIPCLAPPPWVPRLTLDVASLPGCSLLHCSSWLSAASARASLQCSLGMRGCRVPKSPSMSPPVHTTAPKLPSAGCPITEHMRCCELSGMGVLSPCRQPAEPPGLGARLSAAWGLDGVRGGRYLLEEEGSGCTARSGKICCRVSQA